MSKPAGFVILSHNDPAQLERLVAALNKTYDHPGIAIHHDFSQSTVNRSRFAENVHFVEPHLPTKWGDISLVMALLAALRLLYRRWTPEWFTMLTASDYPVMDGSVVVEKLRREPYDLYLDWHVVEREPAPLKELKESGLDTHQVWWRRLAYERYVGKAILVPSLNRRLQKTRRRYVLRRLFIPFTPWWKCFAGETFFWGNAKVADILLAGETDHPRTFKHFSNCFAPDEAIFHTLLCNHSELRICTDNKRYSNWKGGGSNPAWLSFEDLEAIRSFGSHFARKFSSSRSSDVLAEIDRSLGIKWQ